MIVELLGSGVTEGVVSTNPKRFTCLLSQTGTNAPTTNILENTLGLTFTASYSFIGGYTFNITSTPSLSSTSTAISCPLLKRLFSEKVSLCGTSCLV